MDQTQKSSEQSESQTETRQVGLNGNRYLYDYKESSEMYKRPARGDIVVTDRSPNGFATVLEWQGRSALTDGHTVISAAHGVFNVLKMCRVCTATVLVFNDHGEQIDEINSQWNIWYHAKR